MDTKNKSNLNKSSAKACDREEELPTNRESTRSCDNNLGAQSSNTAPYTCKTNTKILRVGVDSLYLSYPGSITEETSIRFKKLKELAQSQAEGNSHLAQWDCRGRIFKVHDRGRHPFAYILHDPWFRIELSSITATSAPMAHCKLASQALTFEGPKSVESELKQIIETLGIPEDEARVSRADLCVDFVTDCDISNLAESDWVTRARTMSQHSVKRQFSGWSIGQGEISPVVSITSS